jgi:hypothetical protein
MQDGEGTGSLNIFLGAMAEGIDPECAPSLVTRWRFGPDLGK